MTLKVWLGIFAYALLSGLAIQLVVLPYVFPQLHAGNGLLAGRDWVGFHEQAVAHARMIAEAGWSQFRLRPDGDNAITGIAALFYVLFGPHPWTLLPLSVAVFATGGVTLFLLLKRLELDDKEAVIALLPYLVFPSALLQYGQIHKDVFCTTAVLVVLWSWVGLLSKDRQTRHIFPLLGACFVALMVLSVFRPYFMYPFLGLAALLLLWYLFRSLGQFVFRRAFRRSNTDANALKFDLQCVAILAAVCSFAYVMSVSQLDLKMVPLASDSRLAKVAIPVLSWQSNKDVRIAGAERVLIGPDAIGGGGDGLARAKAVEAAILKAVEECRPIVVLKEGAFFENLKNRVFLKIAVARAGFTSSGGLTAASNIDKGIDFCRDEDLVHYVPRALQIAFFAPFPSQWLSTGKRNSSPVEIYISAVEMFYCYIAYLGLFYWAFSYRRWNAALVVPVAFAFGLMLLLGLTVANVGTLYRMRFPFAMIFVSIGMAGILQLAKIRPPWIDKGDAAN